MRSKPFQSRWGWGRVSYTHTDTAENAETNHQAQVAFHETGYDAACCEKQSTDCGPDFGTILVLNSASRYHEEGKEQPTDKIGKRPLGIRQIRPARVNSRHYFAQIGFGLIHQSLFPYAPCIKNSQTEVAGGTRDGYDPSLCRFSFICRRHGCSSRGQSPQIPEGQANGIPKLSVLR